MSISKLSSVVGLASVAFLAVPASATRILQVDFNAGTGTVTAPFSTNYTGMFKVTNVLGGGARDMNAVILDLLVDGTEQGVGQVSTADFNFNLMADFVNGKITGGSVEIVGVAGGVEGAAGRYTAQIVPNNTSDVNILQVQGSGLFVISGLTFNGFFDSADFFGFDVTEWDMAEPLRGNFDTIAFQPGTSGTDNNVDVDVFIQGIPLPTTAGMGLAGLALVGTRRRR
ncbi:MAG: hypothetical protein RBS39_12355 [Phycisphaerales bacterium]|nr:hypothetical protein [Phycisphaerales bacterium]